MKFRLLFLLLLLNVSLIAQEKSGFTPDFRLSQTSAVSSGEDLPFWMVSNQNGTYTLHNSSYLLFQAGLNRSLDRDTLKKWGYSYGANMVYGIAGTSDFQPNPARAGLARIPVSTADTKSRGAERFSRRCGIRWPLLHQRKYVPLTQCAADPGAVALHKRLYPVSVCEKMVLVAFFIRRGNPERQSICNQCPSAPQEPPSPCVSLSLPLSLGLEHYVFWGGYSVKYGQLPEWSQYLRYVTGLSGGEGAALNDQMNASGNQLGSYNLELKKEWTNSTATFYWNHPYDDRSGMELDNLRDGLWGIHVATKNRTSLVTDAVYEFMNTQNQSGSIAPHLSPTPDNPNRITGRGIDTYFNHMIYASGYVHYNRMIGTPILYTNNWFGWHLKRI